MKGVILAGGTGSRLHPLTKVVNKHMLPLGPFPMIYYSIYKLWESSIHDIHLVSSKEHLADFIKLLGDGRDLGVKITYYIQEIPGGIADAIGLLEEGLKNEKFVVVLGDNIFEDSLKPYINEFLKQEKGARVLLKKVSDPDRYGIAHVHNKRIKSIVEKPTNSDSDLCVTGIYMFDRDVFHIIQTITPSNRGELEITDVNNKYIENNSLYYSELQGWWIDAGTLASYQKANDDVLRTKLIQDMSEFMNINRRDDQ